MAYTLISGKFHIHYPDSPRNGPQPDGDTIRFEPDQPALVNSLRHRGQGPSFNSRGYINIRFEAIDALESHFQGHHQPLNLANAARDAMLAAAGYSDIQFHEGEFTVASAKPLSPRGYLLSRTLDHHGRIVAFVFAGDAPETDGSQLCLRPERVQQSINAALLESGRVYPSFYDTLPSDLREALKTIAIAARTGGRGLWPENVGTEANPAVIRNRADVQTVVIFPKLFRRLANYFASGAGSLSGFIDWLREEPGERDDNILLPPMELANLHDILRVDGDKIWLTQGSEAFVIIDTPETWRSELEQTGCGKPPAAEVSKGDLLIVAALPNPAGRDQANETVTILNTLADSVDLAGYRLQDDDGGEMALHGVIPGGETLRVRIATAPRLNNRGDTIRLVSPGNAVIDEVSYTSRHARSGRTVAFGR